MNNIKKFTHLWHLIGNDPFVDWVFIFSVSITVSIVVILVGTCAYADGARELASAPPVAVADDASVNFDAHELSSIVGTFDARATERLLLSQGYSGPSDPSLP
jgi:hypothetical protein